MLTPIRRAGARGAVRPEVTGRRQALASARGLTPGGGRSTAWYQIGRARSCRMPARAPIRDQAPGGHREAITPDNALPEEHQMASELTEAMIVNGVVLATVLASDLGPARKIGRMRLLRPVIAAVVIIPIFISAPDLHGSSLAVELAGIAAGLLGGLAAAALMHVYRSPATGRPVSRAGWGYGVFWTVVIGARAAFSYGAAHWFTAPLVTWAIANRVTEAAITDGLIFMAVMMIIVRTAALGIRAGRLPGRPAGSDAEARATAPGQPA
jgi:hypothetical protein